MKIWTVDLVDGTFSELIDVENRRNWTTQVTDLAGVSDCCNHLECNTIPLRDTACSHCYSCFSFDYFRSPLTPSMRHFTSCPRKARRFCGRPCRAKSWGNHWTCQWLLSPKVSTLFRPPAICGLLPNRMSSSCMLLPVFPEIAAFLDAATSNIKQEFNSISKNVYVFVNVYHVFKHDQQWRTVCSFEASSSD
jgi:hypothetical protein